MDDTRVHIRCPHCSATNRLPAARIDEAPNCGKCGQLLLQGQPLDLDDSNFDAVTAATKLPVLVDFWAPWCGPCRVVGPVLEEIASEREDVRIVKLNVDENQQTAAQFGVMSIPTMIIFKAGQPAKQIVGAYPKKKLIAEIEPVVA